MLFLSRKKDWIGNIRGDLLSGMVVALALIPEAIAFSLIAGVDPKVGLYASFCIAVITALFGGRPAMISAATGAMALLMVTLVKEHGLEYLLAATVLTGLLQLLAGYMRVGGLMSFVSRSVVTGFVNALAILIFWSQMPELLGMGMAVYFMTFGGLAIIYLFPSFPIIGKTIPSPLVAIIVLTFIAVFFDLDIRNVGDMGALPDTLPIFLWPEVPFNFETLRIIFPTAAALAVVGLLESLMTATIVDEMTETSSDKNRECKAQGLANMGAGFLGGMAGCAMIGQSVINVTSGGRGRLSTMAAGIFLLILVVFFSTWISVIPMAALVAVMIMVAVGTFRWDSVLNLRVHPLSSSVVMVAVIAMVLWTHNLALGVFVGVLLSALFFANKISHFMYAKEEWHTDKKTHTYFIRGQVFFHSAEKFIALFDFQNVAPNITIDLTHAHFWDISAVDALDKVVLKLRREGAKVSIVGRNEASTTIIDRFGLHDKPEEIEKVMGGH